MKRKKNPENLKRDDLKYLAGFFDGEGCISISKSYWGDPRRHSLKSTVGNQVREIPYLFKKYFGGDVQRTKSPKTDWARFIWRVTGKECLKFLEQIGPFLKIKKEESILGIKFQNTKNPIGKHISGKVRKWREKTYWEMKAMKSNKKEKF